jgi:hypothetical protein
MKFCGNLIDILAFGIIVHHAAPLINFVLFPVGYTTNDKGWQFLEWSAAFKFFTEIERTSWISVLFAVIRLRRTVNKCIASLIEVRIDDIVIKKNVLLSLTHGLQCAGLRL